MHLQVQPLILFDPKAFQESFGELKLADYCLGEDQLLEWAVRTSRIRAAITQKAAVYEQPVDPPESDVDGNRSRRGLKLSTKARHPEGLMEKELRAMAREEPGYQSRVKRRRQKELSVHEQAQIISAYCDDFQPQKEVALHYRVTPALVGRLVKRQQEDPFHLSKQLEKMWTAFAETEVVETAVADL